MSDSHQLYLRDLGTITAECAREAIEDRKRSQGSEQEDFKTGYMMAFHRIVTLMQQQAQGFGIALDDIGLADMDESEFFQ